MKKFWKVLGFTALVAGLAPYKVEKNEETGENSYQSLLMRVTSAPGVEEGEKRRIGINLGEGTLTSKILDMTEKKDEPHLFSDEISVEYDVAEKNAEVAADEAEKEVEKIVEAAEAAAPEEPVEPAPAEPVAPQETVAAEEPKAEE